MRNVSIPDSSAACKEVVPNVIADDRNDRDVVDIGGRIGDHPEERAGLALNLDLRERGIGSGRQFEMNGRGGINERCGTALDANHE